VVEPEAGAGERAERTAAAVARPVQAATVTVETSGSARIVADPVMLGQEGLAGRRVVGLAEQVSLVEVEEAVPQTIQEAAQPELTVEVEEAERIMEGLVE
jgi:hypothetical protein